MERLSEQQRQPFCSNTTSSTRECYFHCNCNGSCSCTGIGVLGCGHYWIPSTKSNVCFPAFLVRLPQLFTMEHQLVRKKFEEQSRTFTPILHQQFMRDDGNARKHQYRWRSKRDFLLIKHAAASLSRKVEQYSSKNAGNSATNQSLTYPKSALQKLCERAAMQGPWLHPDARMHTSVIPVHVTTSNSWVPQQQKSLQMVNEFVSHMYQLYCYCLRELSLHGEGKEPCLRFKASFEIFCHENDPADIILHTKTLPAHCTTYRSIGSRKNSMELCTKNTIPSRSIVTSSMLGQYFASTENVDYVIRRLLQTLVSMKLCAKTCTFVEPSVGDGRILSKLISSSDQFITATTNNQTLQRQDRRRDGNYEQGQRLLRCIGYDIDPSAVQMAYKTLSRSRTTSPQEQLKSTILCQDFLTVSYQEIMNLSPCSTTNDDFPSTERHVIVVGGPPYTATGRNDEDETCTSDWNPIRSGRVDLTKRFVLHSLLSLRASVVVFILPQRCKWQASDIHRELSLHSNGHATSVSDPTLLKNNDGTPSPADEVLPQLNNNSNSNLKSNCRWSHFSEELPNSQFDFQGKWVKQPSILQIWICSKQC